MSVISKELRKKLVDKLDTLIKLKGVGEVADGPILNLMVKTIDKYVLTKLSLDMQETIVEFLEDFLDEE